MTDPSPAILASLLTDLQALSAATARLEARLRAEMGLAPHDVTKAAAPAVADDADLDGQWGNPQVRKDPPRWTGQSYAGANYSDCPPEFLDTLAGFLEWQAGKADEKNEMASNGKPRSMYLKKDASRARGHAARNRAKAAPRRPAAPSGVTGRGSMGDQDDGDDMPF